MNCVEEIFWDDGSTYSLTFLQVFLSFQDLTMSKTFKFNTFQIHIAPGSFTTKKKNI